MGTHYLHPALVIGSGVVNPLKGRGAGVKSRANICAETVLYAAAEGAHEAIVAALLDTGTDSEP